jgi:hypothetical protein
MAAGFEPATAASFGQSGSIQTRAGFDVIGLLPVHAGERLRQLRQKSRDAHSLPPEFADRLAANTARGDAERWVQRLLAPDRRTGSICARTTRKSSNRDKSLRSWLTKHEGWQSWIR